MGQWAVGSGQWAVGSGQWAVGSGQWAVGSGRRCPLTCQYRRWIVAEIFHTSSVAQLSFERFALALVLRQHHPFPRFVNAKFVENGRGNAEVRRIRVLITTDLGRWIAKDHDLNHGRRDVVLDQPSHVERRAVIIVRLDWRQESEVRTR